MLFSPDAPSAPGDSIFEWQNRYRKGQKKAEVRKSPSWGRNRSAWPPFGSSGKNLKTGQWERTFAILTGEPNELVAPIHPRMTTFLEPRDYDEYLSTGQRPPVHLLRILPAEQMKVHLVETNPITNMQVSLFDPQ